MKKRESYGPQRSPFKIFLYIVVVVLLLGGIAYLVKDTRARRAVFQEQIQELRARETEFVQTKQSVITETETEAEENKTAEKTTAVTAQTEKDETSADAVTEAETDGTSESETGSETAGDSTAVKRQHILLLNGSGKDGMAAKWQKKLTKAGYTNVTVASFPGLAIEQTRIYVEKEEDEAKLTDLKAQFSGVEVTTDAFTADITLEDGSAPKDVELYIIIGKNDAAE